jgi:hypothetical protein
MSLDNWELDYIKYSDYLDIFCQLPAQKIIILDESPSKCDYNFTLISACLPEIVHQVYRLMKPTSDDYGWNIQLCDLCNDSWLEYETIDAYMSMRDPNTICIYLRPTVEYVLK